MSLSVNPTAQAHPPHHAAPTRARAIVVDNSADYVDVVLALLDFHEFIDLVGRASNVDEALQLVEDLRPELVLVDLGFPGAYILITALARVGAFTGIQVVAMSEADSLPVQAPQLILKVRAFIRKTRFREEFPLVFRALLDVPWPSQRIASAKLGFGEGCS